MAKRGRKPKENKKEYFGEEQEKAVLEYLKCETKEGKEMIFEKSLRKPFEKMVESIIRKYGLYVPDEVSGDTFNDTTSFLLTKMDKFKADKNKKAYSYYGTICRHYLVGKIEKYAKEMERNPLYDTVSNEIVNNPRYMVDEDESAKIAKESIGMLVKKINKMVDEPSKYSLRENEVKVGKSLVNLFENWDYVLTTDGSNKLNKNAILLFLRDSTGLDQKSVRDNMKKFKKEFFAIKNIVVQ